MTQVLRRHNTLHMLEYLKVCLHCTHDMDSIEINPLRLDLQYKWIVLNWIRSRSILIHFGRWFQFRLELILCELYARMCNISSTWHAINRMSESKHHSYPLFEMAAFVGCSVEVNKSCD